MTDDECRPAAHTWPQKRKEDNVQAKTALTAVLLSVLLGMWPAAATGESEGAPEVKPVLLVVDVQNIWLPQMADEDRSSAPQRINEAIALFREFGQPVMRVYHSDSERGPEPDTEAFEFSDSIAVTDDDLMIIKAHASAFKETELEQALTKSGRNVVFLCGLSATGCVLATYYGALERDFMVFMIEDALLSRDASHTDVIEEICYSMTIEELREDFEARFP
jgi:nicotinamidase-related amidase